MATVVVAALVGVALSVPPNTNCCAVANNPAACNALPSGFSTTTWNGAEVMQCPNRPDGTCSFDNCVGGIGVDCEGVPLNIDLSPVGVITPNLARPQETNDGSGDVMLRVAVGSILHDLCCIKNPHGAFCHSSNYPIGQTLNLLGNTDQSCACLMEWRKAAWNLLRGRYWNSRFSTDQQSSNLTPRPEVQRKSWLPKGSGTNYLPLKDTWGITEVEATARLCAPPGTRLDCPSEDNNCKVPCIGVTCKACAFGCDRRHRNRWGANGRNHAHAGDSDFCCSGEFKEVYWAAPGTRYGTCK